MIFSKLDSLIRLLWIKKKMVQVEHEASMRKVLLISRHLHCKYTNAQIPQMLANQIKFSTIYHVAKLCASPQSQLQIPDTVLKSENYWSKEIPIKSKRKRPIWGVIKSLLETPLNCRGKQAQRKRCLLSKRSSTYTQLEESRLRSPDSSFQKHQSEHSICTLTSIPLKPATLLFILLFVMLHLKYWQ